MSSCADGLGHRDQGGGRGGLHGGLSRRLDARDNGGQVLVDLFG